MAAFLCTLAYPTTILKAICSNIPLRDPKMSKQTYVWNMLMLSLCYPPNKNKTKALPFCRHTVLVVASCFLQCKGTYSLWIMYSLYFNYNFNIFKLILLFHFTKFSLYLFFVFITSLIKFLIFIYHQFLYISLLLCMKY